MPIFDENYMYIDMSHANSSTLVFSALTAAQIQVEYEEYQREYERQEQIYELQMQMHEQQMEEERQLIKDKEKYPLFFLKEGIV